MVEALDLVKEHLDINCKRLQEQYQSVRAKYGDATWDIKKELLIAEDDETLQVIFREGFHTLYNITMVSTLKDLKKKLEEHSYPIAILDIYLKGGKSSDILDKIKECVTLRIFISAMDISDDLRNDRDLITFEKPGVIQQLYQ